MKAITTISLGAGVQSSAMLVCSVLGLHGVPKADAAIFADVGNEPSNVYRFLKRLQSWNAEHGGPTIHIVRAYEGTSLGKQVLDTVEGVTPNVRFSAIPLFTIDKEGGVGMLRRQCTKDWKIVPIQQKCRQMLGIKKGERANPRIHHVKQLIGISVDEAHRMKPSRLKYIENCYPLVDARLTRMDCRHILEKYGLPNPPKSACVFCPYRNRRAWVSLKKDDPKGFAAAVDFDRRVRKMGDWSGIKGKRPRGAVNGGVFVHHSMLPLDEAVRRDSRQGDLFEDEPDYFGNECEGMCGV